MQDCEMLPLTDEDLQLIEEMRNWLLDREMLVYLPFQAKLLIETEIPLMLQQIRTLQRGDCP